MHRLKPANVFWNADDQSLVNADFGDIYFQGDGVEESRHVFLESNNLSSRFSRGGRFQVGECGFGSGLNFLLTWKLWAETAPAGSHLHYFSIENRPVPRELLAMIYARNPELKHLGCRLIEKYPPPFSGEHTLRLDPGNITLTLYFGEAEAALRDLDAAIDAWFLDGFAPAKNPDIWQESLLTDIARNTKTGGTFATFTAAGAVRRGLSEAGFSVTKTRGFGRKREMLTGILEKGGKPASAPASALVLGAGIAGCSAATALARRGIDVTLIDAQEGVAARTSGNPAGLSYPKLTAAPSPAGDFYLRAFLFARRLFIDAGPDVFNPCGVLHLDMADDDTTRHAKIAELTSDETLARVTDKNAVRMLAGIDSSRSGLFMAMGGCVFPPALCQHLAAHPKIKSLFMTDIDRLAPAEGGKWQAFDANGNSVATADCAVIAAGTMAHKFLPSLPFEYLRGQVSFLTESPASKLLKTAICHDGYISPSINGAHCAGATFDKTKDTNDFSIREEDHARNIGKLIAALPSIAEEKDVHVHGGRTGYRTALPDRLPLADAVPGQDGLYALAALGSHGMTTAPLLGELIAAKITAEPLPLDKSLLRHLSFEKIRARRVLGRGGKN